MTIEELVIFCIEDLIGYTPKLSDRFVADLDLKFSDIEKLGKCLVDSLYLEVSDRDFSKILSIIKNKTVLDLIKVLEYAIKHNTWKSRS